MNPCLAFIDAFCYRCAKIHWKNMDKQLKLQFPLTGNPDVDRVNVEISQVMQNQQQQSIGFRPGPVTYSEPGDEVAMDNDRIFARTLSLEQLLEDEGAHLVPEEAMSHDA